MLEELKGGECSWCGEHREKEAVALTVDKNNFLGSDLCLKA